MPVHKFYLLISLPILRTNWTPSTRLMIQDKEPVVWFAITARGKDARYRAPGSKERTIPREIDMRMDID